MFLFLFLEKAAQTCRLPCHFITSGGAPEVDGPQGVKGRERELHGHLPPELASVGQMELKAEERVLCYQQLQQSMRLRHPFRMHWHHLLLGWEGLPGPVRSSAWAWPSF